MPRFQFIAPSDPIERALPPEGDDYEHEIKWDGWRAQLHKQGADVHIFSRNGKWLPRFKPMLEPLSRLPAKSVVIDAEFVALNAGSRISVPSLVDKAIAWCASAVISSHSTIWTCVHFH